VLRVACEIEVARLFGVHLFGRRVARAAAAGLACLAAALAVRRAATPGWPGAVAGAVAALAVHAGVLRAAGGARMRRGG